MDETTNILKNQIDRLPTKLREYLAEGSWSKEIDRITKSFGLQEYQTISIKNEVLFVIIGLEPYLDLQKNIVTETGMSPETILKIVLQISEQVLDKIEMPNGDKPKERQNNVGNDFEQTILNQARAMQPARERSQNLESGSQFKNTQTPNNLPTGETQNESPRVIHNYTDNDPYRESPV